VGAGPAFDVRAGVEPALYHGRSGSLLQFDERTAAYDEDTRNARVDDEGALAARLFVAPTVRFRAGSVVGSAGAELEWWRADVDGAYFYEPGRDTLLRASGDTVLRTSVSVLREWRGTRGAVVRAGVQHRLTYLPDAPDARVQRPGLAASWTLGDRRLGLREPTLAASAFWYLDDPYKQGQVGVSLGLRCRLR
jgi:hypothetical protein